MLSRTIFVINLTSNNYKEGEIEREKERKREKGITFRRDVKIFSEKFIHAKD